MVMLFEKLVLFINKNAYIIIGNYYYSIYYIGQPVELIMLYSFFNLKQTIALHGTSFCESSRAAFQLILSKSFKIAIVNLVADFILFVGKIVVVLITLLVGIEFIKDKEEKLNYSWGPLLIPTIFSYFIAHCFLTVYEVSLLITLVIVINLI